MNLGADKRTWSRVSERKGQSDNSAHRYYLADKEGIDFWNAYVAEHGLPLSECSDVQMARFEVFGKDALALVGGRPGFAVEGNRLTMTAIE